MFSLECSELFQALENPLRIVIELNVTCYLYFFNHKKMPNLTCELQFNCSLPENRKSLDSSNRKLVPPAKHCNTAGRLRARCHGEERCSLKSLTYGRSTPLKYLNERKTSEAKRSLCKVVRIKVS